MLFKNPMDRPKIEEIFKIVNNSLLEYDKDTYTHINFYFKYFDRLDSRLDKQERDTSYWKNIKK